MTMRVRSYLRPRLDRDSYTVLFTCGDGDCGGPRRSWEHAFARIEKTSHGKHGEKTATPGLEYTGVCRNTLKYTGEDWSILEHTGVYWSIMEHIGIDWNRLGIGD